jgi:cell division protein FtsZ
MGILLNITGGSDLGLFEVNEAAEIISSAADADCNIIFGAVVDPSLGDEVRVTVIATGFDGPRAATQRPADKAQATPGVFGAEPKPSFDVSDDVLDIPSFLKDR